MEWFKKVFDKDYIRFQNIYLPSELATKFEVDFIQKVLNLSKDDLILDLGCGFGRIATPLAKKNFNIIGVDMSDILLSYARRHTNKKAEFISGDMRNLDFKELFDKGFNAFSSFGYFKTRSEDNMVLKSISRSLKSHGLFLFDLPNKDFIVDHFNKKTVLRAGRFTFTYKRVFYKPDSLLKTELIIRGNGKNIIRRLAIRLYNFRELSDAVTRYNLHVKGIWGGVNFEKFNKYDSKRMFILLKKK